jgi:phosphate transport system ATP-binding protein
LDNPGVTKQPTTAHPAATGSPAGGTCSPKDAAYSIVTENLSLWYGTFQALIDVSVKIKQGIITSLIGPSGCGKTTVLRSFNRVNERYGNVTTKGHVWILGKNIYEADVALSELRKCVGMVFQRPNPLPVSVYENIVFGLKIHSPGHSLRKSQLEEVVETSLKEVLLWDRVKDKLHKKATHLQLEEQQKLCIARLLPLKPSVILMDEPCSALDARGTEAIEDLMEVMRERFTIVIVTHNMAQARRVSDECIFMLMGKLIEHGPTVDVFLKPRHKDTENYVEGRYG